MDKHLNLAEVRGPLSRGESGSNIERGVTHETLSSISRSSLDFESGDVLCVACNEHINADSQYVMKCGSPLHLHCFNRQKTLDDDDYPKQTCPGCGQEICPGDGTRKKKTNKNLWHHECFEKHQHGWDDQPWPECESCSFQMSEANQDDFCQAKSSKRWYCKICYGKVNTAAAGTVTYQ